MAIIAPFDLTLSFFRNSLIGLFARTRTNYTPRKLKLSSSCNFKELILKNSNKIFGKNQ